MSNVKHASRAPSFVPLLPKGRRGGRKGAQNWDWRQAPRPLLYSPTKRRTEPEPGSSPRAPSRGRHRVGLSTAHVEGHLARIKVYIFTCKNQTDKIFVNIQFLVCLFVCFYFCWFVWDLNECLRCDDLRQQVQLFKSLQAPPTRQTNGPVLLVENRWSVL